MLLKQATRLDMISGNFTIDVVWTKPKERVMGPILTGLYWLLFFCAFVFVIDLLSAVAEFMAVVRPLKMISANSQNLVSCILEKGAEKCAPKAGSIIREINDLQHSFGEMVMSVKLFTCYISKEILWNLYEKGEVWPFLPHV